MNNKVYTIWSELEDEHNVGLMKRLYSGDIPYYIYCTYEYPEVSYGIALSFPKSIKVNLTPFQNLAELKVSIFDDTSFADNQLFSVRLFNPEYKDVFSELCENLICNIVSLTNIKSVVQTFGNTLVKWKELFGRAGGNGLTKEEQLGLYGELYLLRKMLLRHNDKNYSVLNTYVGVNRELRDFQGKDWAIEVKTTSTNNPQVLSINGERQLDDTMVNKLYLFHLSVESNKSEAGETLVDIIDSIKVLLNNDVASLNLFKTKLLNVGYFDVQTEIYKTIHYKIRKENFYHITGDFPRIRESELRSGVGGVHYGITISMCTSFIIQEDNVFLNCTIS